MIMEAKADRWLSEGGGWEDGSTDTDTDVE